MCFLHIERLGNMDQYVLITVYSDFVCSKRPKSYFLCLNIMYIPVVYYIRNEVTFTSKRK